MSGSAVISSALRHGLLQLKSPASCCVRIERPFCHDFWERTSFRNFIWSLRASIFSPTVFKFTVHMSIIQCMIISSWELPFLLWMFFNFSFSLFSCSSFLLLPPLLLRKSAQWTEVIVWAALNSHSLSCGVLLSNQVEVLLWKKSNKDSRAIYEALGFLARRRSIKDCKVSFSQVCHFLTLLNKDRIPVCVSTS